MFQPTPGNYSLHGNYQMSTTGSYSPLPKPEDRFSEPWNQTALRVPRYESSFTAFGLSPEPDIESLPSPLSKSRPSHKKSSSRSPKFAPGPGRKEESATSGWNHIVVEGGAMKTVNESKYDLGDHGSGGRRTGKLPKEAKEKAARVRKVKACWNCWQLKVPVCATFSDIFGVVPYTTTPRRPSGFGLALDHIRNSLIQVTSRY
jgi:hypothetical protein